MPSDHPDLPTDYPNFPDFVIAQIAETNLEPLSAFLHDRLDSPDCCRKLQGQGLQLEVRMTRGQLQVMLKAEKLPQPRIAVAILYGVLRELPWEVAQPLKVYGLRKGAKTATILWSRELTIFPAQTVDERDLLSFQNPNLALAVPIASLLAVPLNSSLLILVLLPLQIWIHEFGHATVAWLGGRRALPVPWGWTSISPERSLFVYFGLLFLLALLFRAGFQERLRWPMVLAGVLAVLQFVMTWCLPEQVFEMWMIFGGVGGEFYLSTLLMVGFYLPLPRRLRWDFWRYPVLLTAASSFWRNFWWWRSIQRAEAEIPWGSLLGGAGDAGGDMNRLVDEFGWTEVGIISTYTQLSQVCLVVLIVGSLFFLIKQNPRRWMDWYQQAILQFAGK